MRMKKFTLFLMATLMVAVSFAQVPQKLGKRVTLEEAQKVQLKAGMKALNTESQRMARLKATSKITPKKALANKQANLSVKQSFDQKAAQKQLQRSVKAQKNIDASKLKLVQKSGKKNVQKAPRKVGGTTPVAAPDGLETETYSMMAFSYYTFGEVKQNVEVGITGNDVYVKGLFSLVPDAWVKGTISGSTVTFAKEQYIGKAEAFDTYDGSSLGFMDTWLAYSSEMESYEDFVMQYDAKTGVMSDVAGGFLFLVIDDDFNALDALRNTTLSPAGAEADKTLVTPPASAEQFDVDVNYIPFGDNKQMSAAGRIAIDGNDIYVAGLCPNWGTSWVKGTIGADGSVTFPSGQYVGDYMNVYDIYFTSISATEAETSGSPALHDAKAVWNAEEKSLIFDKDCWIVENAGSLTLMFYSILTDVEVYASEGGDRGLVFPPAGLETKEYKTTATSLGNYGYGAYTVKIGFDGDDAYMQGLLYFAPTAWLKGTRNADGSITFLKNQYLGTVQGFDVYVVPCDDEENILDSYTFKYDAAKDSYTYKEENTNISFSIEPESALAVEIIYNVVLKGEGGSGDDEFNVITEQPEGDLKTYTRSGGAYYSFFGYLIPTTQGGASINIVTNGNDVYMENPISQGMIEGGSWVKGTIEGNKIHMPLKQCTAYSEDYGYGYMTAAFRAELKYDADYDEEYIDYVMTDDTEVTFTIDDANGTITLDQTSIIDENGYADWIYGLAYTDDLTWAQVADYNTVYNLFTEEITTIPEGLKTESWAMMYNDENGYSSARLVDVAIDGNKMYIAGMSEYDPEAAYVGTISEGKVTFASDQYLGTNSGYIAYGLFANDVIKKEYDPVYDEEYEYVSYEYIPEYSLTYDAEKKMMKSADDVSFVLNAGKGAEEILYITAANAPKFNYFEEVAATPADPEFQDYANWFDDYGYDILACNVKLEDVDGKYINKDKVYYTLWVNIDGEKEQFLFDSEDYVGFAELGISEMTEIPYGFTVLDAEGFEDISEGGSGICIYQTGFDDFGIQTIYYGGDERNTSNIVWWNNGDPIVDGISTVETNKSGKSSIHDLQGRKLQKLQKGINIVTVNGKTAKIIIK